MNAVKEGAVLLSAQALSIGFARKQATPLTAVNGVDLELRAGETFALVGESGSGKSLTALALMRLLPPAGRYLGGEIRLGAEDVLGKSEAAMRHVRGGRVAMIFQEPGTSLNPVMTVGSQIGEALERHRGLRGEAARAEALALLRAVGIADVERRIDEYPFQFSGGMKQRVMIAIALAGEPEILLADEPTTALDVTVQAQILALLKKLQVERGMAMLLITHDLGIVAQMAERVGVMYAGELVEVATRAQFLAGPRHPYTRALIAALPEGRRRQGSLQAIGGQVPALAQMPEGCRFATRCPLADARCSAESPGWTTLSDGHAARCHHLEKTLPIVADGDAADAERSAGDAVLQLDDLRVHFPIRRGLFKRVVGHVRAVDGVSLAVRPGRTLALVGESGCGKTTVGKAALRLIDATAGSIELAGQRIDGLTGRDLHPSRRLIQMVFQDPYASLNPKRSVGEILREGLDALAIGAPAERAQKVEQLLAEVGLDPAMAHRYPHEFSGGQRQRIAIARALAVSPKVIVCDEPTSALDVSVQAQILNLMRRVQREHAIGYLFITHNLGVVDYLADEVAVMYLGRIVEEGRVDEIMQGARHPYTQALLAAVPKFEDGDAQRDALQGRLPGEIPSPANPPSGCHFHPRCPYAQEVCRREYPGPRQLSATHVVRCHFPQPALGS